MRTLILSLLFATSVFAQEPALTVVASEANLIMGANDLVKIGDYVYLRDLKTKLDYSIVGLIRVTTEAKNVEVIAETRLREPVQIEQINNEYYQIRSKGEFWIDVTAIDFEKNIYGRQRKVLKIGNDPTPEPEPTPTPTPAPIPEPGLHVLLVWESADASALTSGQRDIFYSSDSRSFLKEKSGNKWRLYDKDVILPESEKVWATALKRPRTSLPWVIISNGTTGYEGPVSENLADFKKLVEQYD